MNTIADISSEIQEPLIPASFTLGRKWYVAEVFAKNEFRAECALKERGFGAYTPRSTHFRKSDYIVRRRQKIDRPLFPGYCFVEFDIEREEWWHPIHTTDGVRSILSNNLIPARIHSVLIERIRRAEEVGEFDYTQPTSTFKNGQNVEIVEGPFAGLIAKIKCARAKKRIRLLLNGLSLDMDACNLARVA